ncbi:MAG: peptide chain release factor N(5)-glutamine methyltransferase [Cyanobacteria bacterium M5B4]|nr:peptide chain release factor N(5)-glutamine methyltransferase [Cyanobacteria bacterium KgW148]PLS69680.1 MAG: peptide chain release factor N(5)-glutamine methyltransferase [Cyanobacteria bacterium M5B4]
MTTFWQWYDRCGRTAELDWLIVALTPLTLLDLRLRPTKFDHFDWQMLDQLWQRHCHDRVPVQYLAGKTTWRDLELKVNAAVLIPRPETELIIDIVQARVEPQGKWCDLGTGSGAIAIGLARSFPQIQLWAVDISDSALQVAQENIDRYDLTDRICCVQGNWFDPLAPGLEGMVSNPPYIPSNMINSLAEVVKQEPLLALDGGEDGLAAIVHLIKEGKRFIRSGGFWLVEVMAGQAEIVADMLSYHDYKDVMIHRDLQHIDRFVSGFVP